MSEPTNPTADGEIADPQGSNFVASFPDTRNTRTVRPDPHSSVRDAKGVISSARASHGGILTSPPDENSIVQVGRITMPVSSALREGILVEQPDGSFVIDGLLAAVYELRVLAKGYQMATGQVTVIQGSPTQIDTITLKKGGKLSGTIRKPDGTKPNQSDVEGVIAVTPEACMLVEP